ALRHSLVVPTSERGDVGDGTLGARDLIAGEVPTALFRIELRVRQAAERGVGAARVDRDPIDQRLSGQRDALDVTAVAVQLERAFVRHLQAYALLEATRQARRDDDVDGILLGQSDERRA